VFLKLAPDTVRLRRMARAFAAGEISEAEYREARREIIDGFRSEAPSQNTTHRRTPDDDFPRQPEAVPQPVGAPLAMVRRHGFWLAIVAGLLVFVLVTLL
jgi:hypothetical protein